MSRNTFQPRRQFVSDLVGAAFAAASIILLLCTLLGCTTYALRYSYFARITQLNEDKNVFLFGMMGFCTFPAKGPADCHKDNRALIYPFGTYTKERRARKSTWRDTLSHHTMFLLTLLLDMAFPDITAVSFLNESFPAMFHNSIPADANDINAVPNPSHDPQIFVATILTILTTCASIAFAAARHIPRFRYSDKHYNRGFTVLFACSLDFLIMGLVQLMYVNGIDELNTRFPNLTAEPGTSQGLTGASLVCLLVASVAFLQGCTVPQPSTSNNVGFEKLF
ncbi:hypothetical protein BC938DRAFT_480818 [Jimgerdemannia flammicorona]|uniref:Uncharacterized protein n=1 Tax=Jimgerdemannia flammicorona TaxID=994334 RepID=A0A433QHQ7_9FUNG|nr:hypothetical protein BC938DRAFT_480818 [Jimgerdemannia flammicorona]